MPSYWILDSRNPGHTRCSSAYTDRIDHKALLAKGFRPAGYGRGRAVYHTPSKKYVVKFPINAAGEAANQREASIFAAGWVYAARCRIIVLNGLTCLIMERVRKLPYTQLPRELKDVDSGQAGRNLYDRIVSYDYSSRFPY